MCEPLKTREKPCCYPMNASAGIYDAQAFRIGNSRTIHTPYRYPDGNKVVARCGAWGRASETDARLATWAFGETDCPRCIALS